jgi:type IV secretion system protein VirB6
MQEVAMQQRGMGLLLSAFAPPMAAMFFQGTLGSFSPYSVFGGGAAASGRPAANGQIGGYSNSGYATQSIQHGQKDAPVVGTGGFSATRTTQSVTPVEDEIRAGRK